MPSTPTSKLKPPISKIESTTAELDALAIKPPPRAKDLVANPTESIATPKDNVKDKAKAASAKKPVDSAKKHNANPTDSLANIPSNVVNKSVEFKERQQLKEIKKAVSTPSKRQVPSKDSRPFCNPNNNPFAHFQ